MAINIEWTIDDDDLIDITPSEALELFIDFFYFARKVAIQVNEEDTEPPSVEEIQEEIQTMLELGGGRFEKPKKKDLEKLLPAVMDKVVEWGLPTEVVANYRKELHKLVSML